MESPEKKYLYHMVPREVKTNEEGREVIYPLNMLKEKFPGLYELKNKKYKNRENIPQRNIPIFDDVTWGDVVQMSAVHPEEIKAALVSVGFDTNESKYYQIDPEKLDPEKTTIFLFQDGVDKESPDSFKKFDPKNLKEHSVLPEVTKNYYKKMAEKNEEPLLFVQVPHIFHKGPIDMSEFPVITVTKSEKK